jgi:cytochrome P450
MAAKGSADLIADLAAAVPVEVIGNLLAVPHEERGPLRAWSLAILGALEPVLSTAQRERGERAVAEFLAYLVRLVADRRAHPGDPARDVLTRLIEGETNGDRLAGRELLRFESSNQFGNRVTTQRVDVGGVAMPDGTFITIGSGAANRDPAEFADPDRLDITREPNRHLAFGSGAHVCAGLNIARLEGRIAIGRFLARFRAYRLNGAPVRGGRARFRGFLSIPVALA